MSMNKQLYKNFGKALQCFFEDYLLKECGASRHTIKSYSETFCLFVEFADKKKKTRPECIQMSEINKEYIREFLDWLERDRKCKPQTRNHRNVVMRSFFKFMMYYDSIHISQWQDILSIKPKRVQQDVIKYLSVDGINTLIGHISCESREGIRDLAMISLLYFAGLRVQELIDLTLHSIRRESPHVVEIKGKGSKKRLVCINEPMYNLLNNYMVNFGINVESQLDRPLFLSPLGKVAH